MLEVGRGHVQFGLHRVDEVDAERSLPVLEVGADDGVATSDLEVGEFQPAEGVQQVTRVGDAESLDERGHGPLGLDVEQLECFGAGVGERFRGGGVDLDEGRIVVEAVGDAGRDVEGSHVTSLLLLNHRWKHNGCVTLDGYLSVGS